MAPRTESEARAFIKDVTEGTQIVDDVVRKFLSSAPSDTVQKAMEDAVAALDGILKENLIQIEPALNEAQKNQVQTALASIKKANDVLHSALRPMTPRLGTKPPGLTAEMPTEEKTAMMDNLEKVRKERLHKMRIFREMQMKRMQEEMALEMELEEAKSEEEMFRWRLGLGGKCSRDAI